MSGIILPAGSPLAQFEVQKNGDGSPADPKLSVIWVDPSKPEKRNPMGDYGHQCDGPFYPVVDPEIKSRSGYRPVICICMGRFVE